MRSHGRVAVTLALLALPGCARGQAGGTSIRPASYQRADTAALHRTLESLADKHRGVVGYVVQNIDTGERLERRADETFPTASLIKVPVLVTVYGLAEQGMLSLDDPLTVLKIDKVPGS